MEMTNCSRPKAKKLLEKAHGRVKPAIVMHFRNVNYQQAIKIINRANQSLREAIKVTE
jgi:N-acetylmuramic acid 6-phosphate (MurNAc-6-P) etherase